MQSHPENTVGLLTTAGKSARILISGTQDLAKVFACMHDVKLDGFSDIMAGVQKAQLALKHRQNLVQRQRIVVFVSSPVQADVEVLVKLAKKLKKNNVAVDIVHVGDDTNGANVEKLDAFIEAVNSNQNSRIIHVPANGASLSEALMQSEIYDERNGGSGMGGGGAGASGGDGAGGAEGFEFGVDPAVDPELAMALRISRDEYAARLAADNNEAAENDNAAGPSPESAGSNDTTNSGASPGTGEQEAYDEDADIYGTEPGAGEASAMDVDAGDADEAMLREAIALSQAEAEVHGEGEEALDEELEVMNEEMRLAIEQSKADYDEQTKDDEKEQ